VIVRAESGPHPPRYHPHDQPGGGQVPRSITLGTAIARRSGYAIAGRSARPVDSRSRRSSVRATLADMGRRRLPLSRPLQAVSARMREIGAAQGGVVTLPPGPLDPRASITRRPPAPTNDPLLGDVHVLHDDDADVVEVDGVPVLAGPLERADHVAPIRCTDARS
jgi:hypothetical protein